jgi:S-adenosylmethionine synthetase
MQGNRMLGHKQKSRQMDNTNENRKHSNKRFTSHRYNLRNHFFTSEAVSEGHPDKVCDQVSDTVLDMMLAMDPNAKVAVEAMAAPDHIVVGGEITTTAKFTHDDVNNRIRDLIREIGYTSGAFNADTLKILNLLHEQSPEINYAVSRAEGKLEGAGDQGIMFGYACTETKQLMPAPIWYSNQIMKNIMDAVRAGKIVGLGPDGKSQVTLEYDAKGRPFRATSIVVSIQHRKDLKQADVREMIRPLVIGTLPEGWMCDEKNFLVNPSGSFAIGGPEADVGITGRKIIVDTYGGAAPHGGGAFSGKDPSKVDRSAAYVARYIAKNVVAAGLAEKCLIQLSYAIGVSKPISIYLNTSGTAKVYESKIIKAIRRSIDLSPQGIINVLKLRKPIYAVTATYGHFGRNPREDGSFSWERTDLAEQILKAID